MERSPPAGFWRRSVGSALHRRGASEADAHRQDAHELRIILEQIATNTFEVAPDSGVIDGETGIPMAEDSAARRARDSALLVKAASTTGPASLPWIWPFRSSWLTCAAKTRAPSHRALGDGGPWLLAVRDIPGTRHHPGPAGVQARGCVLLGAGHALVADDSSDGLGLTRIKYRLPIGDLRGMYSEIAFHVAVRLDLSARCSERTSTRGADLSSTERLNSVPRSRNPRP